MECAEHQPAARKTACHGVQIGQLDCRALRRLVMNSTGHRRTLERCCRVSNQAGSVGSIGSLGSCERSPETPLGKATRENGRGWQDKASSSLAGPMALSCCLHIVFWVFAEAVRGQCAAWSDSFLNDFNALSCHAAPQAGRTLRHGLSLHATLRWPSEGP